jgi:hypothetical protein
MLYVLLPCCMHAQWGVLVAKLFGAWSFMDVTVHQQPIRFNPSTNQVIIMHSKVNDLVLGECSRHSPHFLRLVQYLSIAYASTLCCVEAEQGAQRVTSSDIDNPSRKDIARTQNNA